MLPAFAGGPSSRRPSLTRPASRSSRPRACAGSTSSARAPADRAWLEEHFDFHPLDYEDVFSRNQRPKVDEYDDYLFVVLHFPRFDKPVGRLNAAELDVFVGPDYVITLPNERARAARVPVRALPHARGAARAALLQGRRLPALQDRRRLRRRVVPDAAQDRATSSSASRTTSSRAAPREIVRDISNVKQEIINFRKIVRPQRAALRDLERTKRYIPEDLDIYFDDINDASERIWDMLENYKEVVEALESTNESVLSHRLNDVLRVLTAFSVIVLPLTLIASVLGMNVGVPGEGRPTPSGSILGVMVVVLVGMVVYFRRRGWL